MFLGDCPSQGVDAVQGQLVEEMVLTVVGDAPIYGGQAHSPPDPHKGQSGSQQKVYELI